MSADRELRAEITIAASPAEVWAVLADLDRMPELSPELVRMLPLKKGGLRVGQAYLGINRRKWVLWPTRSVVVAVEPPSLLVWDTRSSGARWVYELSPDPEGTRVVHRRPVPSGLAVLSKLFAPLALGGSESHADELEQGMVWTLLRLKAAVEA